ncbi:MAG: beta-ketoacyl-[acyl-carrier-protein] synthase family protein [Phycisphaerales bacterium]|nr:beta-ketoacyl-[acyl-carrier-protein] synthase family protein [Phycisphaerales bacterium]
MTGMGWVTPLGGDVDTVWERLVAGASAIGLITRFQAETFPTNFGAEVKQFDLNEHGPFAELAGLPDETTGRSARFALAAAARAMQQAGLGAPGAAPTAGIDPERMGVYLGAGEGTPDFDACTATCLEAWSGEHRTLDMHVWAQQAYARMEQTKELEQEPYLPVTQIARHFGARGPSFNCMTACAASTQSVGEAVEIIRRDDADIMIAGGSHTMLHPFGMTGFIRLTAMSKRRDAPATAARPFDQTRDGFVMGEGAGVVILEELSHALARGAKPLVEVVGYGSSADAYRITDIQPEGLGAIAAMRSALAQAGIDPAAVGEDGRPLVHYISAHGTGTKENDAIETKAVRGVFGDNASRVPFSSVKSMLGHLIQAAGAVELMTCVQAIRTGFLPPTMNLHNPDPACDLDYVPNRARDMRDANGASRVHVAMSNGFGFGGQNDTLVIRRFDA